MYSYVKIEKCFEGASSLRFFISYKRYIKTWLNEIHPIIKIWSFTHTFHKASLYFLGRCRLKLTKDVLIIIRHNKIIFLLLKRTLFRIEGSSFKIFHRPFKQGIFIFKKGVIFRHTSVILSFFKLIHKLFYGKKWFTNYQKTKLIGKI